MVTVLLVMMVLTSLVTAAIGYGLAAQPLSRRDQDATAALAAAQAGIDDYTYRLRNADFEKYNSANLPASPDDTPMRPTTWLAVPGTTNGAKFHYDPSLANGVITLTSTGSVHGVRRTVQALIRRRSFLDYLYFTDYEVIDPASGFYLANKALAASSCDAYWWDGRPSSPCSRISFTANDVINGPMHTNDTISVTGSATFNARVTTSSTANSNCTSRRWWATNTTNGCGTPANGNPNFTQSGDPTYASIVGVPTTSGDLPDVAAASGCLYNGPTRIVFKSNGKMDVTSPTTVDASIAARCVGSNLTVPGVLHVQSVPSSQSVSCPSSGNKIGYPITNDITRYGCKDGDAFVSGTVNGRVTVSAQNDIVVVDNVTYNSYSNGSATDMLGLIAEQFVKVYHPVSCPSTKIYDDGTVRVCQPDTDFFGRVTSLNGANLSDSRVSTGILTNPTIHAAVLALNHSFIVQNYNTGAQLGTLTVFGAISQKWRGPVGLTYTTSSSTTGQTGFTKAYNYDARLAYEGPPNFIDPIQQPWKVKAFSEIANPGTCTSTVVRACVPPG
jgi:hypothetical protein